ncbi:hypothetical protein [Bacillus sp. Marseille-P3661]|uniref:hypothetical protein n=1 Tax=Bacillus sp. Marseille-P3661 TaxID=1936234 RepID=UPI000C85AFCC|nr:hypothetical protein [Bacillus sp. Marseille-P3661]
MQDDALNIGLNFGVRFLTKNVAYFLGLLMADEQVILNDEKYWIAPVRHNPKQFNPVELEEHYNIVKSLAVEINKAEFTHFISYYKERGVKFKKYNAGKDGFVTLFKQEEVEYSLDDLIDDISFGLQNGSSSIKRAFLVGVFDGRSSYDKTYKFIAMDIENDSLIELLGGILGSRGIEAKINNSLNARKRDNLKAKPRKGQIRIKYEEFLSKIGFISPIRFGKATVDFTENQLTQFDELLPGLKIIK